MHAKIPKHDVFAPAGFFISVAEPWPQNYTMSLAGSLSGSGESTVRERERDKLMKVEAVRLPR